MVFLTPRTAAWMPPSLLPAQRVRSRTTAPLESGECAWRAHVREILAHDLPMAEVLNVEPWDGLLLKFTAMWSGETKRVSVARESGPYLWRGEHFSLALPNSAAAEDGTPTTRSELLVELCSRTEGESDEVLAAARVPANARSVQMNALQLLSPAYQMPLVSISFRLDTIGLSRADADLEWGIGKSAKELARNASAPPGRDALATAAQLSPRSLAAVPSAPELSIRAHGRGERGGSSAADAAAAPTAAAAPRDVAVSTTGSPSAKRPASGGRASARRAAALAAGALAAQPTTELAWEQLKEIGVELLPPPPPPPPADASPRAADAADDEGLQPSKSLGHFGAGGAPRAIPLAFGSSMGTGRVPVSSASRAGLQPSASTPSMTQRTLASRTDGRPSRASLQSPPQQQQQQQQRLPPPRPFAREEAWLRPQSAPSARLLMGLDECARIKAAFLRHGMQCPTAALEKALLLPEDQPAVLCFQALPKPTHMRPLTPQERAEMLARIAARSKKGKGRSKSPRKAKGKKKK